MKYPRVLSPQKPAKAVALEMHCFRPHPLLRWNLLPNLIEQPGLRAAFWRVMRAWGRKLLQPTTGPEQRAPEHLCEENP